MYVTRSGQSGRVYTNYQPAYYDIQGGTGHSLTFHSLFAAGELVNIFVEQNSGSALNLVSVNNANILEVLLLGRL